MISSYEIGAVFSIQAGGAIDTLAELGKGFQGLNEAAARLNTVGETAFAGVEKSAIALKSVIAGLITQAGELGDAWKRAAEQMGAAMNAGASPGTGRGGGGTGGGGGNTPYRGNDLRLTQGDFDRATPYSWPRLSGPGGGGGGVGGGGAGGGGALVPYSGGRGGGPGGEMPEMRVSPGSSRGEVAEDSPSGMGLLIAPAIIHEFSKALNVGAVEDKSIDQILNAFDMDPRSTPKSVRDMIRDNAQAGVLGTSFDRPEALAGEAVLARPMALGSGQAELENFLSRTKIALRAAEAAKQLGLGDFTGTMAALPGFMHELGDYDVGKLGPDVDLLGKITKHVGGEATMASEAKALSYIIPTARGLGADETETIMAAGWLQRAGLTGTIGPTTLRQAYIGQLVDPKQPHDKHIQSEGRQLEEDLKLEPGALTHSTPAKESLKMTALKALHIKDGSGKSTDLYTSEDQAADHSHRAGDIDPMKMFERWREAYNTMTGEQFGTAMKNAYGVRGEQAQMLGEHLNDKEGGYKSFREQVQNTKSLDKQLEEVQGNFYQKSGTMAARITEVGDAIVQTMIPAMEKWEDRIIGFSTKLREGIEAHPESTKDTAFSLGGMTLSGLLRGGAHLLKGYMKAPVVGGIMGKLGAYGMVASGAYWLSSMLSDIDDSPQGEAAQQRMNDQDKAAQGLKNPSLLHPFRGITGGLLGYTWNQMVPGAGAEVGVGPRPGNLPFIQGTPLRESHAPSGPVTVTNNITITGNPDESTINKIVASITAIFKNANATSSGVTQGSHDSPYTGMTGMGF